MRCEDANAARQPALQRGRAARASSDRGEDRAVERPREWDNVYLKEKPKGYHDYAAVGPDRTMPIAKSLLIAVVTVRCHRKAVRRSSGVSLPSLK